MPKDHDAPPNYIQVLQPISMHESWKHVMNEDEPLNDDEPDLNEE